MASQCFTAQIWTDPYCLTLKRFYPRDFILLLDMERLRGQFVVAAWTAEHWAANLGITVRRFERFAERLRGLNLLAESGWELHFCPEQGETRPTITSTPRPKYPSDERRRSSFRMETSENAESLRSPCGVNAESVRSECGVNAESLPVTGNRYTGTGDLYINPKPVTGTGEPVEKPAEESARETIEPVVRMSAPVSLREELIVLGMDGEKAAERLQEFGNERVAQVLAMLTFDIRRGKTIKDKAAWVVDALVKGWQPTKAMEKSEKRTTQERLNLPVVVTGTPVERPNVRIDTPTIPRGLSRVDREEPCQVPMPDWLKNRRRAVSE